MEHTIKFLLTERKIPASGINKEVKNYTRIFLAILFLTSCDDSTVEEATKKNNEPTTISITNKSGAITVPAGLTLQMEAIGGTAPFDWIINTTSSTISNSGLLTAGVRTAGTKVEITVTDNFGNTGSKFISIEAAALEKIIIRPLDANVISGESIRFSATGLFSDDSNSPITELVTWASLAANSDILFVAPKGTIQARAGYSGSAIIRATLKGISKEITLKVNAPSVLVNGFGGATSVIEGKTLAMSANGGSSPYRWEIDDPLTASIDPDTAILTGIKPGTVTVTATDSTKTFFGRSSIIILINNPAVIFTASSIDVAENLNVITQIVASDIENDSLTYSISGGVDANNFDIGSTNGILTFNTAPNYESPIDINIDNIYHVIVGVNDGITLTTKNINISITNILDDLDPNYGTLGIGLVTKGNITGSGDLSDVAISSFIDSSGNILVTGYSEEPTIEDYYAYRHFVMRYTSNGLPDNTFNFSGARVATHTGWSKGYLIHELSDKSLIVLGNTGFYGTEMLNGPMIARYTADGQPDSKLNQTGFISYYQNPSFANHEINNFNDVKNWSIDRYGKYLVVGARIAPPLFDTSEIMVCRLTSSGALDTTFSGDGCWYKAGLDPTNPVSRGWAVTTDSNDNIIVAGYSANQGLIVWRISNSGAVDLNFNSTGYITVKFTAQATVTPRSIVTDGDNNIYVTGTFQGALGTRRSMFLSKFLNTGGLDLSFNSSGYITNNLRLGYGIMLDSNSNIVVSGNHNDSMMVWMYNQTGSLDKRWFYETGIFKTGNPSSPYIIGGTPTDIGRHLIEHNEGMIVVGTTKGDTGFLDNGSDITRDIAVWRLQ